jgi:glutamate racemase
MHRVPRRQHTDVAGDQGERILEGTAPVPVLGVIAPGARAAVSATRGQRVGVIGTNGTIGSGAYQAAIAQLLPEAHIVAHACPLFVPLAEEGFVNHDATSLIARDYLAPLRDEGVDALVLGCTHYPLLRPVIQQVMGPDCAIVDSATTTAHALATVLEADGLLRAGAGAGTRHFYATDISPRFQEIARAFFGPSFGALEHVDLVA